MFYKECEICSCKISKLKLYTYKKDLGIYTLQCPNCKASYGLKPKMSFVMVDAVASEIFMWANFLLPFFSVVICDKFISNNVAFLIFVWLVSFLGIWLFFETIREYLNLFIFSKFVLIDDGEKIEVKKSKLKRIYEYLIKLCENIKALHKECEICSYKISKLKSFSYKKDLGIYTLQCPNCNALYSLKRNISNFTFSNTLNIIFGMFSFIVAFMIAIIFVDDIGKNKMFFACIFFISLVILLFIFSIIERYFDLFIFSKFILNKDTNKTKTKRV